MAKKSAILLSPECQWGENLKILNFFIFWFFDFVDRLYIITYGPDMFIARGPARGVHFLHVIWTPKVVAI